MANYTATYIPEGWGTLVWLLASNELASVSDWQAQKMVAEGTAKWAQIHVKHEQHIPPWGDVALSTDPDTVDVWVSV